MTHETGSATKQLAIFDFDGTITTTDSLMAFMRHSVSPAGFALSMLRSSPFFIAFATGIQERHVAKEKVFSTFYKGWRLQNFQEAARGFTESGLKPLLRSAAMEKLRWHTQQNHQLILLSASPDLILRPFCDENNMRLISTKVDVQQGQLTGKFASLNCHGTEKVRRLRDELDLDQFDYIYGYGDTKHDRPFLDLVDEVHYKPFQK